MPMRFISTSSFCPHLCAISLAVSAALVATPVLASSSDNELRVYAIAPASLESALNQFGRESGILLSFDSSLVDGLTSSGLAGEYDVLGGLNRLLQSTNLRVQVVEAGSYRVVARTENSQGPLTLAPITIRGELQQRNQQDSQTSVGVVGGEQLDESSDRNLYTTFNALANLSGAAADNGITIRGVESRGVGGGSGLTVNVTVDGASLVSQRALRLTPFSTWDLAQIEVLRGPQSTQSGRNALAGTVNVQSQDPVFEQEFKARADYASYDETRLAAAGNLAFADDTLALRVSVEDFGTDGFIENPRLNQDDFGRQESQTYRAKLRFRPSEKLDLMASYSVSENTRGARDVDAETFPGQFINTSADLNLTTADFVFSGLRINYTLNDNWRLFARTSHQDTDHDQRTGFGTGIGVVSVDDENLSQEVRVHYQNQQIAAVMGFYYADIESVNIFDVDTDGASFGNPFAERAIFFSFSDIETRNRALFGELDYRIGDNWTLTAGARFDTEENTTAESTFFAFDPQPGWQIPPVATQSSDYHAFLPKLGLTYAWTEDLSTGFTVQRGYRAGGSGIDTATGESFEYDPEFTNNYEVSLRSQWLEGKLNVNANLYFTEWQDQQVFELTVPDAGLGRINNAGESELWGFEVEMRGRPIRDLSLFANLGYAETEFTNYVDRFNDFTGNEFPFAPKWTAATGMTWYVHDNWIVDLNANFTDSSFQSASNDVNEGKSDAYFLVNLGIRYESDNWSASLFSRNLFDRHYALQNVDLDSPRPGEPRIVGLQFNINY